MFFVQNVHSKAATDITLRGSKLKAHFHDEVVGAFKISQSCAELISANRCTMHASSLAFNLILTCSDIMHTSAKIISQNEGAALLLARCYSCSARPMA